MSYTHLVPGSNPGSRTSCQSYMGRSVDILIHTTPVGEVSLDLSTGIGKSPLPLGKGSEFNYNRYGKPGYGLTFHGRVLQHLLQRPTHVFSVEELYRSVYGISQERLSLYEAQLMRVTLSTLRIQLGETSDRAHGRNAKKVVRSITGRGVTIASDEQLIDAAHPDVQQVATPWGDLAYNDRALLARSPMKEDDSALVGFSPQIGGILNELVQSSGHKVLKDNFRHYEDGYLRVQVAMIRKLLGDTDRRLIKAHSCGYELSAAQ